MSAPAYSEIGMKIRFALARAAGLLRPKRRTGSSAPKPARKSNPGLSVVIPSRNGRELLQAQLPGIARELGEIAGEIVVVDNGSDDGTAEWLAREWPQVIVEASKSPLSFSAAVNRGIERSQYSHVCLLNNDMLLDAGFFGPLGEAFDRVPDLFCATAQIRFPEGVRREETGKAVMAQDGPEDFPIRCDIPIPGEDLSYVLYGSGGCSVYDAAKLEALGNMDEAYQPAYVEDLDIGYRAWQRGWPTVYVAGSVVEHRHRATTSRYYTSEELDTILEVNYLKFLARAIADAKLFRRLWRQAIERLRLGAERSVAMRTALAAAANIALAGGASGDPVLAEETFLALTNGSVAVFPGRAAKAKARVLVAATNLRKRAVRAAADRDLVLVAFSNSLEAPPAELLASCVEVVLVLRPGRSDQPSEEFRAALRQTVKKWQPAEAVFESRAMAPYTADCAPAKVKLAK